MQVLKANDPEATLRAVEVLEKGGLTILPTETIYGIAASSTSEKGVRKLGQYKKKPLGKPMPIAVINQDMAEEYAELNPTAKKLYQTFLPGPLTVVSKGKHKLVPGVESEIGTLGIRIPGYDLITKIIKGLGNPIVLTAATNIGKKRPYEIDDVLKNISEKQKALIDLIIDAGTLPRREPSTVIDTTLDDVAVLRQGEIMFNVQNSIFSRSEETTMNTAKELWQKYEHHAGKRAIVYALEGEMGVGKTIFTKGLAKAMGIAETVTAPTYSLNDQYSILNPSVPLSAGVQYKLEHIDAWRMQAPEELEELGIKKMISDKSVLAIEWADRVVVVIRKYNEEAVIIWVKIEYGEKENDRKISWGVL